MDTLFIALFEILSFGAIVVLVVLGLGIIASMMGIFNFAQGEFVLLGAYITYLVHSAGLPVAVGMVAAPFAVGALGLVVERLVVRRVFAPPPPGVVGPHALGLGFPGCWAGPGAGRLHSGSWPVRWSAH